MALQRVRRICPERIDDAHDFVPNGKRNVHHRTITMERLGIADANCAALHFENSLIVAGHDVGNLLKLQFASTDVYE
jgi:hypothetical protein